MNKTHLNLNNQFYLKNSYKMMIESKNNQSNKRNKINKSNKSK